MRKFLVPAVLFVSLVATSSAFALPLASQATSVQSPRLDIVQVQLRRGKIAPHGAVHGRTVGRRYAPGARLRAAPSGWRRYGARPGDWQTRGCVLVGVLWFCP